MRRAVLALIGGLATVSAFAQLSWVGNTSLFLYGQPFPKRAGFIEDGATITVTTQTNPIAAGQSVVAVVTTDNFATSQEYVFSYDQNVGQNTQWYALLGPFPSGKEVKFYIRASGAGGAVRYDNNGGSNYSFYARWTPRFRNGAILQWFETDYSTMLKRLPQVAKAGYAAIYLPPPQKSPGGGLSTGYNPFDRFDLGDRLAFGTVRTRYGTSQELHELIQQAHRFGIEVYADLVYNHNANRAQHPLHRYPDMIPEDFHIRSSADTGNNEIDFNSAGPFSFSMLNHDLVGLVDIAQEDHNNTRTGDFVLPSYAGWNGWGKPTFVRHPKAANYYPGGTPVSEDVRGLLKRWGWFLTQQFGFDGYRLDAVKHVPPGFFDFVPDADQPGSFVSNGDAMPALYAMRRDLYIFAEDFSTDPFELREYTKTGMNMLDFPLKFVLDDVFNSSGFGNLGGSFSNGWGLNGATGLAYEYGGLARDNSVSFVQSHDQGPPWSNNLAHALIMGRPARPLVYYDGNNLEPYNYSQFPKPGRYDALGDGGDTILRMVQARNRGARGYVVNRWVENSLYIFERQLNGHATMLVGLNLRGDIDQTRTVQTTFAPGTTLRDLSGQRPDVVVAANGQVSITVPSNSAPGNTNNARGYVFYLPAPPEPLDPGRPVQFFATVDETSALGAELTPAPVEMPSGWNATPQSYESVTIPGDRFHLVVRTDASGASAFVKFNEGIAVGLMAPLSNTPEGLTDGFIPMTKVASGRFELRNVVVYGLPEGLHTARVRVFADSGNRPGVFQDFVAFFQVRRSRPITVDGDLSDLGSTPLASQTRTPSSPANRLDLMFVTNDDLNLYVGLAGNVDASENLTNGIAMLLDVDPGGPNGLLNIGSLEDDSGPATRLLSNARVATSGIRSDFGLGVFRGSRLGSAYGLPFVGQPILPPVVGAFAGVYRLTGNSAALTRRRAAVAFQPRPGPFSEPKRGWECAIPLRDLFTGPPPTGPLGFLAYLLTTGESGTVLSSTDPLRGVYGGYGQPVSWVSNQILPPQSGITSDPGTNAVTFTSQARKSLQWMTPVTSGYTLTTLGTTYDAANRVYRRRMQLTNTSGAVLPGWIAVRMALPSTISLQNPTETSLAHPGQPYVIVTYGPIRAGGSVTFTLDFRAPSSAAITPTFTVLNGRGIL